MHQVIQGDCLEVLQQLPSESVDAVITDPPYCSGGYTEAGKQSATVHGLKNKKSVWFINDNMTTMGLVWLLRNVAIESCRILKVGSSALFFCDWRMVSILAPALESSGLQFRGLICWDKGSSGLGWGFRPQHELILHFTKGKGKFHSFTGRNVIQAKRVSRKQRYHPTQKPVELIEQLLPVITPKGGKVVDPFCGVGSVCLAAQKGGYQSIGIEIDPSFVEIAQKRLGIHVTDRDQP